MILKYVMMQRVNENHFEFLPFHHQVSLRTQSFDDIAITLFSLYFHYQCESKDDQTFEPISHFGLSIKFRQACKSKIYEWFRIDKFSYPIIMNSKKKLNSSLGWLGLSGKVLWGSATLVNSIGTIFICTISFHK